MSIFTDCYDDAYEDGYSDGYAKAIDEFAEAFDKWIKSDAKRTYYWTEFQVEFMKIAEQLKGGAIDG